MSKINYKYDINYIILFRDKNKKLPNINNKFIVKNHNKKKVNIKHKIKNPWISSIERKKKDFNINKKITEFLNIISYKNFDIIVNNFKKIYIKDINCLKNIVKLIYDKTIIEENYIKLYVNLVLNIINIYPNMILENQKISFISIYLENINYTFFNWNKIDINNIKEKYYIINNIILIGHFFNKDIINKNTIYNYIDNLLEHTNNDFAVELIFKLIKIIYNTLDKDKLLIYINILKNINNISSKNKFLLLDILEINNNNNKQNDNIEIINTNDNKIKNILLEYFNNLDLEDLLEYYLEYKNNNKEEIFYSNIINLYIETNKENKEYLNEFIKFLYDNNYVSININNIFNKIYNNINEYIIDYPNIENDINNIKKNII